MNFQPLLRRLLALVALAGLCGLAPGLVNQAHAYPELRHFPDLTGYTYVGQRTEDIFPMPAGAETTVKGYQRGNVQILTYEFAPDKIYGFAILDFTSGRHLSFFDLRATGAFNRRDPTQSLLIDFQRYGIKLDTKRLLPDVLWWASPPK